MALATAGRVKAGAAYIELTTRNKGLTQGLRAAQASLRSFGQSLKGIGADLLQTTGVMLFPITYAIKKYSEFDDKIKALQAISGATVSETNHLRTAIRKLGATTAFTAQQVASGAVELARMGFGASEINDGLKPVMDLVRSSGEDVQRLGEISLYAANQLRIFDLSSSRFADVCDVMAMAANKSATTVVDLGEAMKIAGPSAASVGEDFRDTASALMLLANAGIRGSLAGTSLRKIYQSLAAQSGKIKDLSEEQLAEGIRGAEQFAALGISVVDKRTGNLRKAADIMFDLSQKVKQMKSGEKINFATDVFDLRGSLGALTMLRSAFDLKNIREQLKNTEGYAAKLAASMESGIGGVLRFLISQFQDLQLSIGQAFSETFMPMLLKIPYVIKVISNFIQTNKKLVAYITLGIGAAFALGVALFALGAFLKLVAFGFGVVISAASLFVKAILLPVTIVKTLIVVFTVLKTVAMLTFAVITTKAFLVGSVFGALIAVVTNFLGVFKALQGAGGTILFEFSQAFADIKNVAVDALSAIKNSLAVGDMQGAAQVALTAFQLIWLRGTMPIRTVWNNLIADLSNSWEVFAGALLLTGSNLVNGIVFAFKWLWQKTSQVWSWLVYGISSVWITMSNNILLAWTTCVASVKKTANSLWSGLLRGLTWLGTRITYAWERIIIWFEEAIDEIKREWITWSNIFTPDEAFKEMQAFEEENIKKRNERERKKKKLKEELDAEDSELKRREKKTEAENRNFDLEAEKDIAKIKEKNKQELNANREKYNSKIDGSWSLTDTTEWDATNAAIRDGIQQAVADNLKNAQDKNSQLAQDLKVAEQKYEAAKAFSAAGVTMYTAVQRLQNWMNQSQKIYQTRYKKGDKKANQEIEVAKQKMKQDPTVGERYVRSMMESYKNIANRLGEMFKKELVEAQSDRVISKDEERKLRNLIVERGRALEQIERYKGLLGEASGGLGNMISHSQQEPKDAIGAWSFKELQGNFVNSTAERTAKATERSAALLFSTQREVKEVAKKMDQSQLTYGV